MGKLILWVVLLVTGAASASETKKIEAAARAASNKYNIEYRLVMAIIMVESGGRVMATGSSHGEIGLMQLHPVYFPDAEYDVYTNIYTGVRYLAKIRERKIAEWGDAWFVAYNTGPHAKVNDPFSHSYYLKVINEYNRGT